MSDGHFNKCKECAKLDVKLKYKENTNSQDYIDKERKRGRGKYHRLYKGVPSTKDASNSQSKYKERFPEKYKAKCYSGHMKPPFDGAEKHHWSYNEEHFKDVIWLSKKDHMKSHRFIVYDQERKMYRRYDTNELLDTKIRHELFISDCIKNKED